MNSMYNGTLEQNGVEHASTPVSSESDGKSAVFIDKLKDYFYRQLNHFKTWNENRDWLAFHHHHYDWWMFPSE